MSLSDQPETMAVNVTRVAVKPPPFWKPNPTLWFAQLEVQYAISGISADSTKFNHVISVIESDVLNSVSDLILHPPASEKYEALKKRLIELHFESQESKIRTLLQVLELGDQRPSQLLTRMRALAGETVGEPLLKSLWLSRLPANTQSILAALSEDLSQLATIADKISDLTITQSVNSTSSQQLTHPSSLELQIEQLTQQVTELSTIVHRERPREKKNNRPTFHLRKRSQSRGRYRRFKEPMNNQCFYHTNFGERARKCTPPCSFQPAGN
ncbi:uncharacterized protein LOC111630366 [Centruroides sculpturatus]|uniref:uncharacterized protein LOC111630366 n=1 Tax=Centruroides sculpturatus TaxID=218467 RepID=UPI000C6E2DFB|nr:uncharacterized protein LOC111630366 [Centruroides sculpturatus]